MELRPDRELARNVDLKGNYLAEIASEIRAKAEKVTEVPPGEVDRLFAIYAVLLLAKGSAITAEDVHNAWTAWMLFEDPSHHALIPYERLDHATAASDLPFVAAIREAALTLGVSACHGER